MLNHLIKNPALLWLSWWIRSSIIVWRHRDKHLEIRLMAKAFNSRFGQFNVLNPYCLVIHSSLGDYTYVGPHSEVHNCTVGKFTSIGPRTVIGLGSHPINYLSTCPAFYSTSKQCQVSFCNQNHFDETGSNTIGNDVWIGANVLIMDNVAIGDGAIVAAGSIVTKDVAPYTIVGGVPAKPIRKRFSDETVEKLLALKWWDKDIEWIKQHLPRFQTPLDEDHLPPIDQ